MKIRIIGSCGSGKSTMARELSERYDIPYYEIDQIIWDRSSDNLKFPEEVRDATIRSIIYSDTWIVEGVQYKDWTLESIKKADIVFILNPNVFLRDYWIIKRFILSRTGMRPWNYKQSFRNLSKMLIKWNHQYDVQRVMEIVNEYGKNAYIIKNKREVVNRIEEHLKANP
jgi:adenylate kinase family enzyme